MKFVVVKVDNEYFGININQIRFIERLPDIITIPKTPSYIKGISNIRGKVTPVFGLQERLSKGTTTYTNQTRLVVVSVNGEDIGLIVDEAKEVIDIQEEQIQPVPSIADNKVEFLSGIVKLENYLLILLDVEKLIGNDKIVQEKLKEINEML